ncbi:ferredoxin--NADP(+) reductase [Pantoea sp. Mhis]|uniref:ferredoxin--NADP(+) reductase n=1 Tax=Pantoea sp. Mhis TaxID=2576759 RepID=UPI00135C8B75|nr:ferredoxin--NADP(+) reductase [Pantoea sp. Mhis]MXP56641.1 ferredoxin--NADP(+) reductase [Pantoea sp. Mhis]
MTNWIDAEVTQIENWTDTLFSLRIRAPINTFIAGQFAKLALIINDKYVQRAYSYVNAPKDSLLEFYLVKVPGGQLSTYLQNLKSNDKLFITKDAYGSFILDTIPDSEILWMLSTGTAIGPYLSILQQGDNLDRFKHIILVHAVRYTNHLSFLPLMQKLYYKYMDKLKIITIVSREKNINSLHGRIPQLIKNGDLENAVGLKITSNNSHVMLCGNPEMVRDTQQLLEKTREMHKHFKHKAGHISTEHYW